MWIPKEISITADKLKAGGWVKRITVRRLLRMFKAERRGMNKVQEIRTTLDHLGLETYPDFESAWIDSSIRIRLKTGSNGEPPTLAEEIDDLETEAEDEEGDAREISEAIEVEEAKEAAETVAQVNTEGLPEIKASTEGVVETAVSDKSPDPTFRIGSFEAANRGLVTVGPDDPLSKAVFRMMQYDYSQLPIMSGERDVKGIVTWRSIGARYSMGVACEKVNDCRDDAQVIDSNGTLFDAIPTIVKHGYVLIKDQKNRKLTGIVTASDLSLQFQQLAEPFILLREIELHIRRLLQGKITVDDLKAFVSPDDPDRKPSSIADLTFGEYVRLFQHPEIWRKLSLKIDKACLTAQLEDVREIRNDVMHFDPDPLTSKDLDILKATAKLMQQMFELLPS
jgi:predicted transcriptional regulator